MICLNTGSSDFLPNVVTIEKFVSDLSVAATNITLIGFFYFIKLFGQF
jgi:hypothetical protein